MSVFGGRFTSAEHQQSAWREGENRKMLQSYNWRGTLESCREVLQSDPDHLGALEMMAHALWLGGRFDEVISTTGRLLRLNPHEPGYRYTRGMAHLSKGNLYKAAEDFRTAMTQSKNPAFLAQVSSALDALEKWMDDQGSRPTNNGLFHQDQALIPPGRCQ